QSMQGSCYQESHQDIQTQLDTLLYAGFLTCTPYLWLQEMPRYFRALTIRLNKLADSPAGDEKKLQLLRPFLQEYTRLQKTAEDSTEIIRLRWMLEEYRVSLFAQPMKTAVPVSPKRIEKQIKLCL
ncbi:ATP-dependent helicase HrpA, partial [hydrothermal vent metagenome]